MFMDRNIQYCHIVDMSLTITCNSTSNSKFMKEITDFFLSLWKATCRKWENNPYMGKHLKKTSDKSQLSKIYKNSPNSIIKRWRNWLKKSIKQSEKIAQSLNTCHMAYGPESHPQNPHEKLASEACACELSDGEMETGWCLDLIGQHSKRPCLQKPVWTTS